LIILRLVRGLVNDLLHFALNLLLNHSDLGLTKLLNKFLVFLLKISGLLIEEYQFNLVLSAFMSHLTHLLSHNLNVLLKVADLVHSLEFNILAQSSEILYSLLVLLSFIAELLLKHLELVLQIVDLILLLGKFVLPF
jgi:hypothetical protein